VVKMLLWTTCIGALISSFRSVQRGSGGASAV
jgi:hypothetical protein